MMALTLVASVRDCVDSCLNLWYLGVLLTFNAFLGYCCLNTFLPLYFSQFFPNILLLSYPDTRIQGCLSILLPQFMVFLIHQSLLPRYIFVEVHSCVNYLDASSMVALFIVGFGYGFPICIDASIRCCLSLLLVSVMVASVYCFGYGCLCCIDASISGCLGLLLVSVMVASVVLMPRFVVALVYCWFRLWLPQLYWCLD